MDCTQKTIAARLAGIPCRPCLFGILNATPDSFSDGGRHNRTKELVEFAGTLIEDGADALDIGGESTRPGAKCVSADEELHRILPAIRQIRQLFPSILLSVDTRKAYVADTVLKEGVDIINDVSGLQFDGKMTKVVAKHHAGLIITHSRGTPENMQSRENLIYHDLIGEVASFLQKQALYAISCGIAKENILLDPGIGFSKTDRQNMELIDSVDRFQVLGFPLFYGISRKGFLSRIFKAGNNPELDMVSARLGRKLANAGVDCLRVHDPRTHFSMIHTC